MIGIYLWRKWKLIKKDDEQSLQDINTIVESLDEMAKILQRLQHRSQNSEVKSFYFSYDSKSWLEILFFFQCDSGEISRLRAKVTKLEKLLAQSCTKLRNNNLLKQGLDHQITSKPRGKDFFVVTS